MTPKVFHFIVILSEAKNPILTSESGWRIAESKGLMPYPLSLIPYPLSPIPYPLSLIPHSPLC